ncbi:hypothetical protein J2X70_003774 [Stenotrophomonas sp. 1337]|nr:hypothetical protein [Stenotrophomonas sp. 1337]
MMTNTQLNRIPSVELQLLTWLRLLEGKAVPQRVDLKRGGFKVHVHSAVHNLDGFGERVRVLNIASVVANPRYEGRGWFTGFLDLCDELNPWDATYVASVVNPRLPDFLRRRGFIEQQWAQFYRPSKTWRAHNDWSPERAASAQTIADAAHVEELYSRKLASFWARGGTNDVEKSSG